jgi:ZIP family zinc transporter
MSAYLVLGIALAAALASPLGGLLSLWHKPSTLVASIALGFASGVLLATISFEMVPKALELSALGGTIVGFSGGFLAVYALDLAVNRGRIVGDKAEQRRSVERFHRHHRPHGDKVTVLAGATSTEELIEGLSIGIGAAIEPGLGLVVAVAIVIDNIAEALSIGELIRDQSRKGGEHPVRRVLKWTGLIGVSLLTSALVGWFALRGLPGPLLGILLAAGGGGMFYLTVTDLLPEAEGRHYQQSAALSLGMGFMTIFALSHFN